MMEPQTRTHLCIKRHTLRSLAKEESEQPTCSKQEPLEWHKQEVPKPGCQSLNTKSLHFYPQFRHPVMYHSPSQQSPCWGMAGIKCGNTHSDTHHEVHQEFHLGGTRVQSKSSNAESCPQVIYFRITLSHAWGTLLCQAQIQYLSLSLLNFP